ncbi:7SK snRNA methylphosphate capping enzyme bin3 [Malaya genurostris]|uniref:7SK snRNA methylphosphate capping enzyme bin3 n=1 Tax=Malaya genurostris TaxID=325434 RepID=UPI0026F3EC92|nr:7SK snRNA methylphosphate capping enzyme bin3 [Malaya genurostris]
MDNGIRNNTGSLENLPSISSMQPKISSVSCLADQQAHKRKLTENDCPRQATAKRKKVFNYGNYDRYYGYRNIQKTPMDDVRLQAFIEQKELFVGKNMLDIGCNNGSLTILIALHCQPSSVVGIDIDGDLIGSARRHLSTKLKSCLLENVDATSLKSVEFRRANYVYQDEKLLENEKPQFDVILCLSVTKWIHLNFGDDAVKLTFKRVFRQLRDGGIFVLEAQPWSSYKHKKKLTPEIYENYKLIQFRPEDFCGYLMGDEIGFRETFELKTANHSMKGFRRPIHVFLK